MDIKQERAAVKNAKRVFIIVDGLRIKTTKRTVLWLMFNAGWIIVVNAFDELEISKPGGTPKGVFKAR